MKNIPSQKLFIDSWAYSMNWIFVSWWFGAFTSWITGIIFNPCLPLAVLPDADAYTAFLRSVGALAVHFAELPTTIVSSTIGPLEGALPRLMIIHILSFILPTIRPSKNTIPVHFILVPVASIIATIFPSVGTLTMNIILKKFTIKLISVVPLEKAFAVL